MTEPESRYFTAQRLKLHYLVWGDEKNPPVILVHGGRDHARNWDRVAEALAPHHAVYAPDVRGHGDSAWAIGGEYSLPEMTADLAALADHLNRDPLTLVGHSMGGAIVLQYSGVFPERVAKVAAIEGLGPPPSPRQTASRRMRRYVAQLRDFEQRQPRRYRRIEDAIQRMREAYPGLDPDWAAHLARHAVRQNEDGTFTWKFDNYVRIHSPYEFNYEDAREIWNQIRCPVLLVRGSTSWATDPEEDGKASAFHTYRSVTIEGAGHWVHHDRLDEFLGELLPFLAG